MISLAWVEAGTCGYKCSLLQVAASIGEQMLILEEAEKFLFQEDLPHFVTRHCQ